MNRVELLIVYKRKLEELFMAALARKTPDENSVISAWSKSKIEIEFTRASAAATEHIAKLMEQENDSKKSA